MSSAESTPRRADPVPVFAALGDRTRLSLLEKLSDGRPRSIARLSEGTTLTRQAVRKHLGVLEGAGLVSSARKGREHRYELRPESMDGVAEYLDDVRQQWANALQRLRAHVEG